MHHKETTAREEAEAAQHKAQKFAESVTEWDRAVQEKNQRLEARVEGLDKELKAAQMKQATAETQSKDLQDALGKAMKKLADQQRDVQRLTDEAERLAGELQEQRSHYVMMRDRFDGEQTLARRKSEELEAMQKRVEELTDVLDRDKHLHSQIGDEEERCCVCVCDVFKCVVRACRRQSGSNADRDDICPLMVSEYAPRSHV
jgi:chromosome segregation ATPase